MGGPLDRDPCLRRFRYVEKQLFQAPVNDGAQELRLCLIRLFELSPDELPGQPARPRSHIGLSSDLHLHTAPPENVPHSRSEPSKPAPQEGLPIRAVMGSRNRSPASSLARLRAAHEYLS